MRYDLAVIGAGPAGLSAALNASIRNKNVIVFGTDSPAISKTKWINNYLGFEKISGQELNENFKRSLQDQDVERSTEKVQQIYAMGDYFAIILKGEKMIEATSVIVSYCATCDASFYKGKEVVLIGYNEESVEEANYTCEVVDKLTYVNMYKENPELNEDIEVINGEIPVEFLGEENPTILKFKSGKEITADGFFIIRDSSKPERLVPSIKTDEEHIITDKNGRTNIRGLYAAGDISGRPYQINKAAGQGQMAALDAAKYISLVKENKFDKDMW